MELLLFFLINSILFCISKNINRYRKFLNMSNIQESEASSWLIKFFEVQSDKSEVSIDAKIRSLQTENQSNELEDSIDAQTETPQTQLISDTLQLSDTEENPIYSTSTPMEFDETIYIFPVLLIGFDQYVYSNNSIQFFAHLKIINFWDIYNLSFPISIKSYGRLRNLEEEIIYMTCNKNLEFENNESLYYFNCVKPYNKTPSSVKFLYKNIFIDGKKANNLILTSYA